VTRYLVTGCAGFIGSHLCESLVEAGCEVLGVDSFSDYYPRATKERNLARLRTEPAFSLAECDLAETALEPLVRDVDGIFHLAAQPGVRGSWGASFGVYVHDNVIATQRLFEAAAARGARVVFASSSSVYGDADSFPMREDARPQPVSPYGVTKLACEHLASSYAKNFGLDAVGMRYFTVYGPRQRPDMAFARILAALVDGSQFTLNGTGKQSRDFTYVADAVAATTGAMERGRRGALYNVGGGAETSLLDVVRICEELSGETLHVRRDERAAGDVKRTAADTTAIRADVCWQPATTLRDGLAAHLQDVLAAHGRLDEKRARKAS